MAQTTPPNLDSAQSLARVAAGLLPGDEAELRKALRHCSPSTCEAAIQFRRHGQPADLYAIVYGVIERYVEPDLRHRMREAHGDLRLAEDLGLDSLTLMQIVFRLEEVLVISIRDEELRQFRTLGEIRRLIERTVAGGGDDAPSPSARA